MKEKKPAGCRCASCPGPNGCRCDECEALRLCMETPTGCRYATKERAAAEVADELARTARRTVPPCPDLPDCANCPEAGHCPEEETGEPAF